MKLFLKNGTTCWIIDGHVSSVNAFSKDLFQNIKHKRLTFVENIFYLNLEIKTSALYIDKKEQKKREIWIYHRVIPFKGLKLNIFTKLERNVGLKWIYLLHHAPCVVSWYWGGGFVHVIIRMWQMIGNYLWLL